MWFSSNFYGAPSCTAPFRNRVPPPSYTCRTTAAGAVEVRQDFSAAVQKITSGWKRLKTGALRGMYAQNNTFHVRNVRVVCVWNI